MRLGRSPILLALAVSALVLATAYGVGRLLGPLLRDGRDAVTEARALADAVRSGEVRVELRKHAAELQGLKAFQFARLRQIETFRQSDVRRLLWNRLALPEVVVEITVPVEYTYILDMERDWHFSIEKIGSEETRIMVEVPAIQFNAPAPDLSRMGFEIIKGSVLRDEAAVLESLRSRITGLLEARAAENIALVREVGRRNTIEYLHKWLATRYPDEAEYTIDVVFADELENEEDP